MIHLRYILAKEVFIAANGQQLQVDAQRLSNGEASKIVDEQVKFLYMTL